MNISYEHSHSSSIIHTMNSINPTVAATGAVGAAAKKRQVSGKPPKAKHTYGGRGMGLMKRPNGNAPNIPSVSGFGQGGKHKYAGKLRKRSPKSKPMRLSRRLSWRIERSTPLKSPITAVMLNFSSPRLMIHEKSVEEGGIKTPEAKDD